MTEQTEIVEFKQSEAALVLLKERYAVIPDFTTKEGYESGRQGIAELRTLRTSLDKARLRLNKDDQDRIKFRNGEAKRITGELVLLEDPLKVAKGEVDMIAERAAEAVRKAEEDRIGFIEAQMKRLGNGMNAHAGMELEHLEIMADNLGDIFGAIDWQEFAEAADSERIRVKEHILAQISKREIFETEQAELETQKAKMAEEKAKLAAERECQRVINEEAEAKIKAAGEALEKEKAKAREELQAQQRKIDEERQEAARVMLEAQEKAEAEKLAGGARSHTPRDRQGKGLGIEAAFY